MRFGEHHKLIKLMQYEQMFTNADNYYHVTDKKSIKKLEHVFAGKIKQK